MTNGGMTKDKKCPRCETDLIEFCFQDMYDEVESKVKEILAIAKGTQKPPYKKSEGVNNKSSIKKCDKGAIKKKCSNKKAERAEREGQKTLW